MIDGYCQYCISHGNVVRCDYCEEYTSSWTGDDEHCYCYYCERHNVTRCEHCDQFDITEDMHNGFCHICCENGDVIMCHECGDWVVAKDVQLLDDENYYCNECADVAISRMEDKNEEAE